MAVDYFTFAANLARTAVRKPTEQDHRVAELRGLALCDRCGKELSDPGEFSQLCGRCEWDLEARR